MEYVAKPMEYLQPSPVRAPAVAEPAVVRALVVEDEPKVAEALRRGLQNEGFEVSLAGPPPDLALSAGRLYVDGILCEIGPGRSYLNQPFLISTHFKKQADATGWNPTPCSAR